MPTDTDAPRGRYRQHLPGCIGANLAGTAKSRSVHKGAPYLADPTAPPDRRRVLVVGGLSIGLYAVAIARALGAEVSYVDSRPGQLAIAEGFGATVVEPDQARRLGPFPVTVSTNGTAEGLRLALRCTEPGGVSVAAGV